MLEKKDINKKVLLLFIISNMAFVTLFFTSNCVCGDNMDSIIVAGDSHTVMLKSNGTVWTWGDNYFGQLGVGVTSIINTPVKVMGGESGEEYLSDIISISAGSMHSIALKNDGTVWAWGNNNFGQLGDGTTEKRVTPVQVKELTGVKAIAAGGYFNLALMEDGTVWSWGYNGFEQLGDGSSQNRAVPVQVKGGESGEDFLSEIKFITAGDTHAIAIKENGTVWAWGNNNSGQLGDGTTIRRSTPVQVRGGNSGEEYLSDIISVSAGNVHSIALKDNKNVYTWGGNKYGQLGDGSNTNKNTPQLIMDNDWESSFITAIDAGAHYTVALDIDGKAWIWGINNYGQLGDDTDIERNIPEEINFLEDRVGFITCGKAHIMTIQKNGEIWGWGRNDKGQLGNSQSEKYSSIPVKAKLPNAKVSAKKELSENTLNECILSINLTDEVFSQELNEKDFYLNNGPKGLTVSEAVYEELNQCKLTLSFDGTDFDTDINDFYISIYESALEGKIELRTNKLSIRALDERARLTTDEELSEININNSLLTITLVEDCFIESISKDKFILNNVPKGVAINEVEYVEGTKCRIRLSYDGSDFDNDIFDFNITIDSSGLKGGHSITTNDLTIEALLEPEIFITSDQELDKSNLDGRLLLVNLKNIAFLDNNLDKANFNLINAPLGLEIENVYYTDATNCLILLVYDGSHFSDDIEGFCISINEKELTDKFELKSNSLVIKTELTLLNIFTESIDIAYKGVEYKEKLQAVGGIGSYSWYSEGLPEGLHLDVVSGEIYGIPMDLGNYKITFFVSDERGNSVSKTLELLILDECSGKYNIIPTVSEHYTISNISPGISTITVKDGVSGFIYFKVNVTSEEIHIGSETLVFVHMRNGEQLSIHGFEADYDILNSVSLGLNVQPNDIIKVYMVDELTNNTSCNPKVLH